MYTSNNEQLLKSARECFEKLEYKKSLVILDMCHHIAGGLPWMTSSPNGSDGIEVTPARVLWVDLENGSKLLKRRMKAFAKALDIEIIRGTFQAYSMPDPWLDLSKPENVPAMIERIKALGDIGVLVIDHLAMVFGATDENSPLASQVMNAVPAKSNALPADLYPFRCQFRRVMENRPT